MTQLQLINIIIIIIITVWNLKFYDILNWPFPSFFSTTFQNFPGISGLLSEVSKFQHLKILCSKYSISLFIRSFDHLVKNGVS
jgi:hypothetical protein